MFWRFISDSRRRLFVMRYLGQLTVSNVLQLYSSISGKEQSKNRARKNLIMCMAVRLPRRAVSFAAAMRLQASLGLRRPPVCWDKALCRADGERGLSRKLFSRCGFGIKKNGRFTCKPSVLREMAAKPKNTVKSENLQNGCLFVCGGQRFPQKQRRMFGPRSHPFRSYRPSARQSRSSATPVQG